MRIHLKKKVGLLCGGSGSSKFASAIASYAVDEVEPGFVANVGDNFWYHGLLVCPDVDIITYSLSALLDNSRGWGIRNDSLGAKELLSRASGSPEWFSLGDRDLAMCLRRTELFLKGWNLSSITRNFCLKLGVRHEVVPATDDLLQTFIRTVEGNLHLQEYWVKNGGNLEALGVEYAGISRAKPSRECLDIVSDRVIICPANPVTSILPTLKLKGIVSKLLKSRVIAISPFVGQKAFSGPAAKLMHAIGVEPNSLGVAKLYSKFLKIFFLEKEEDRQILTSIRDMGIECVITNTRIKSDDDKEGIAKELVAAL